MSDNAADVRAIAMPPSPMPRRVWSGVVTGMWVANVVLLVGVVAWVVGDGRSQQLLGYLESRIGLPESSTRSPVTVRDWSSLEFPLRWMGGVVLAAVVTLAGIFVGLFTGQRKHRNLRAWLALTFLIGSWLTMGIAWREFHWWGQQVRMQSVLNEMAPVVQRLHDDWPQGEGQTPDLGRYMAYPKHTPRTLLLMRPAELPAAGVTIDAVERSADGAIRLELAGDEEGAWLEWRPQGGLPHVFVSGLGTVYRPVRVVRLEEDWFLVHYRLESGTN